MNGSKGKWALLARKTAGWCIAAVSIGYLVYKLKNNPVGETLPSPDAALLGILAVSVLMYSMLNILLARVWARFVIAASGGSAPGRFLIEIYLRSGIVKYLPGNIFHLAGRHLLAGREGVGQGAVLAANIYEMAVITITAMLTVIFLLLFGELNELDAISAFFRRGTGKMGIIVVFLMGISAAAAFYFRKKLPVFLSKSMAFVSLEALPAYLVFFSASSLILSGLLSRFGGDIASVSVFAVAGVFCMSWIAGFLAPGAPGGLGVRETVIVLMLGSTYGDGPALGAALLLRVITAAGDVLSFGYSFLLKKKGNDKIVPPFF